MSIEAFNDQLAPLFAEVEFNAIVSEQFEAAGFEGNVAQPTDEDDEPVEPAETATPAFEEEQEPFSAILRRAQAGDEAASAALYRRTRNSVANAIRDRGGQREMEDAEQETFLGAFRHLAGFELPEVEDAVEPSFRKWLKVSAGRNVLDAHKRNSKRVATVSYDDAASETNINFLENLPDPYDQSPDEKYEEHAVVVGALSHVPERFRQSFYALKIAGLDGAIAAEQMGIPRGTLGSQAFRGRDALARAILAGEAGEDLRQMAMEYPKAVEMLRKLEQEAADSAA